MHRRDWAHGPAGMLPEAIKWLLIANVGVFVVSLLLGPIAALLFGVHPSAVEGRFLVLFGLQPERVIEGLWVWQPLTYMFLHGGLFHLLFNMFLLWVFGAEIERIWGRAEFLRYYVLCGLGAAALSFVFLYDAIVIGASGAVLGVLLAFGLMFPNRYILLWFLIPIRAKYLVAGMAALEVLYLISQSGGQIANAAHVGGMLAGWLYLKWGREGRHPGKALLSRWRRRHLKVVDGGPRSTRTDAGRESEIDRILDKISKHGLHSLTPEEERILDEASRQHRD